jgi:hypothetical protein
MSLGYSLDILEGSLDQVVSLVLEILIDFSLELFFSQVGLHMLTKTREGLSFA